jgi:hypothetical protein
MAQALSGNATGSNALGEVADFLSSADVLPKQSAKRE